MKYEVVFEIDVDPQFARPDKWDWDCMLGVIPYESVYVLSCKELDDRKSSGLQVSDDTLPS